MINWRIPSLEYPPEPEAPRLILWVFIMVIVGVMGFGLGIYLSANEMQPNTMIIEQLAILPALFILLIRLLIYLFTVYRHKNFTDMLDHARQQWRYWAGQHFGLLAHSRLTRIDEDHKYGLRLSSLPPNKDNVLKLNALKSLALWEKQEKVVHELLAPIAEYYHKNALTNPITFYWQAQKEDGDWVTLIQEAATRLSLNIESIEPLPYSSLSEWLIAVYDPPFELKLYAHLSFQLEETQSSEEASCLLLAPQALYTSLRIAAKTKLLRPISTDRNDFSHALKMLCEFQLANHQLNAVWQSDIPDGDKGKCIENYIQQNITCLSEHLYDVDSLFGKGDLARHGVILSLASECPQNLLIVHQHNNRFLLQQIIY